MDWPSWPLWVDLPQFQYVVHRGQYFAAPAIERQPRLGDWERLEAEISTRRRSLRELPLSRLWSADALQSFRRLQRAMDAGGLRFLSREGSRAAPETVVFPEGGDLLDRGPVLRVCRQSEAAPPGSPTAGPEPLRAGALVYCNPAGEVSLPVAKRQADAAAAALDARYDVRAIFRPLHDGELHELLRKVEIAIYFGHGLAIDGAAAIAGPEGYTPLFSPAWMDSAALRCFVFGGCLPGGLQRVPAHSAWFLYPACRLADREDAFLSRFVALLGEGREPTEAHQGAIAADREAGDIRRYLFRMQCPGETASWPTS